MSVFFQVKHFPQLCKSPGFGALFLVKSTKNERREKERVYADFRISWKQKFVASIKISVTFTFFFHKSDFRQIYRKHLRSQV